MSDQTEMQINPTRAKHLAENLSHVANQIKTANTANRNVSLPASSSPLPTPIHTPSLPFQHNY